MTDDNHMENAATQESSGWDDPWMLLLLIAIFSLSSEQRQAISENLRKTLEEPKEDT